MTFLLIAVFSALFSWTSYSLLAAEVTLFLWSAAAFSAVPALQINVVAYGKKAPNLVSTLNIAAFNVGNALGAWVGGCDCQRAWFDGGAAGRRGTGGHGVVAVSVYLFRARTIGNKMA